MYCRDQHENHSLSSYFDNKETATATTPVSPLATTAIVAGPQRKSEECIEPTTRESAREGKTSSCSSFMCSNKFFSQTIWKLYCLAHLQYLRCILALEVYVHFSLVCFPISLCQLSPGFAAWLLFAKVRWYCACFFEDTHS